MEDRLRFVQHKGKNILLIDVGKANKQEIMDLLARIQDVVTEQPRNSVLTLADFTESQIDKEVATRIKELLVFDRPFVKRSAWVGTKDLPRVFYENFKSFSQRDFPAFNTREEAMEWLASE